MPTSAFSPIVAPWTIEPWPTVAPRPMTQSEPEPVCSVQLSCTEESPSTTMRPKSPLSEAPAPM